VKRFLTVEVLSDNELTRCAVGDSKCVMAAQDIQSFEILIGDGKQRQPSIIWWVLASFHAGSECLP
jgi:hypothetical protein